MGSSQCGSNYLPPPCLRLRVILVISLSRGFSEVIQMGRKSQFCSVSGKQSGLCDWSMLTVATNTVSRTAGMPTPVITFHPAMERANTRDGRSRKQRSR